MDRSSLEKLSRLIRSTILTITTQAGSGHPTSSLSAVELMTTLFFKYLRYDLKDPKNPANDRLIFSKGHASPLYYALYGAAGVISDKELLQYRTFHSVLEGHPTPRFRYTEAATGSLGQGLSIGLGEALAVKLQYQVSGGKYQDQKIMTHDTLKHDTSQIPRVFVLAGDGELAEGSVWEAAAAASFKKVDNLFLIADMNRLGQSDPTMYEYDLSVYKKRFEAFGWRVVTVTDGNNLDLVDKAFEDALAKGGPTVILAKTKKGSGISFLEDAPGWHGKPLSKDELPKALAELGDVDKKIRGVVEKPEKKVSSVMYQVTRTNKIAYEKAKPVATRKAFGNALARLGASHPELVVVDGDVKNSTYTEFFGKEFPNRFFEMFIAEQNMAGVAVGLSARGYHPVVSSFACFLTRAADQIRMASLSGANIIFNGSHAGVSIGEDGGSQMGLEDIALFRTVQGSTVFYPSDAVSTERLVELALAQKGIVYIRTSRPETPILYDVDEKFVVGGSKTFESSVRYQVSGKKNIMTHDTLTHDTVTVVAAGVTLHEALKAQKALALQGVGVRVIDCYSIKPIDQKTLTKAASETKAIIVVEDHYPEGGLGEAVLSALAPLKVVHLAVTKTPRSGKSAELLAYEGIDSDTIIKTIKTL